MASVSPGFVWSSTTPITAAALNLTASPTVTIGSGEIVTANFAANQTITGLTAQGLTIPTPYKLINSVTVIPFSGTISLQTYGNTITIACTGSTASTITPSSGGTAGQELCIIFTTDATGGNVITYASPFATTGTHTLTGASKRFTSLWRSDGTKFAEIARTAALT